jgi:hypothetical protein
MGKQSWRSPISVAPQFLFSTAASHIRFAERSRHILRALAPTDALKLFSVAKGCPHKYLTLEMAPKRKPTVDGGAAAPDKRAKGADAQPVLIAPPDSEVRGGFRKRPLGKKHYIRFSLRSGSCVCVCQAPAAARRLRTEKSPRASDVLRSRAVFLVTVWSLPPPGEFETRKFCAPTHRSFLSNAK